MEKVTFQNCAAQGDLLLRRVSTLPEAAKKLSADGGVYIVAHSQTGHHHVIDATLNVQWYGTDNPLLSYLEVNDAADNAETLLRHLRDHDTHKTLVIPPGVFELRRQREYTPGNIQRDWRMVMD